MTGAAGNTTTTDSRSRRNRASRRGGQLLTRARSLSYTSACPHLRAPGASVPDGRTIRHDHQDRSRTSAPESSYRLPTPWKACTGRCARSSRPGEVFPATRLRQSYCSWRSATPGSANVLDKLPKRVQPEAKYPKAADCLSRDRHTLLTFYDFPAAHWQHLRTTNPIESTFATIRLRTVKTRTCLSVTTALSLVHQLAMSAQKRWRRLRGFA